ncbi:hypothetical protein K491DRAFT_90044 [Lophiostoma macrostomum CBS 122681]|uniref:Uncharacterized protein n=1 Tax=Lophiostoma macrostomum CBS 122681 TaxID=1314788 RepID=A0A6A6SYA2_9PLEO|nr:hypothetical protein K491DRAFT_90044 [Lophiostoma macrostomum CBS 122681]
MLHEVGAPCTRDVAVSVLANTGLATCRVDGRRIFRCVSKDGKIELVFVNRVPPAPLAQLPQWPRDLVSPTRVRAEAIYQCAIPVFDLCVQFPVPPAQRPSSSDLPAPTSLHLIAPTTQVFPLLPAWPNPSCPAPFTTHKSSQALTVIGNRLVTYGSKLSTEKARTGIPAAIHLLPQLTSEAELRTISTITPIREHRSPHPAHTQNIPHKGSCIA